MSNIVLDANDQTGVRGVICCFFVLLVGIWTKEEILEGLQDLSLAAILVIMECGVW